MQGGGFCRTFYFDKDITMENENLVNFITYCRQRKPGDQTQESHVSEELSMAIQTLIQRLRECNPLKQPS